MKKSNLWTLSMLSLLFVTPLTLHAQVKVDSTGALSIGRDPMKRTYFSIGDSRSGINPAEAGIGIVLHGRKTHQDSASNTKNFYGVYSRINMGTAKKLIGLFGHAGSCPKGYSFGVVGYASGELGGVGIYGSTSGYGDREGESVNGRYAGYFAGPTYVRGTLTATEVITPSDITLKENIVSIEDEEENVGSTLDNLMNMNVIKYNYKPQKIKLEQDEDDLDDEEKMLLTSKAQVKNGLLEMSRQKHYGLSAQEIREIYPDVVRESEDGILGVNYLELVPILIRSIQELKAELDEVKSKDTEVKRARAASFEEDEDIDLKDATSIPAMATLAQNTPNPFSERTTIRFTLPENAQNAFIYIFDMSGKMQKQIPVDSSMESVIIEGYELRAGMYIYSLVIGGKEVKTRRMIMTK